MARVLVTGMSGAGKSSALVELARRGHKVVDTDDAGWCEWTRLPCVAGQPPEPVWVWREQHMADLLASHSDGLLFVAGCVSNQRKVYDGFDAVTLLTAPAERLLQRVAERTTNDYGKNPEERARIGEHIAANEIDTTRPVSNVVDELIRIAEGAGHHGDAMARSSAASQL